MKKLTNQPRKRKVTMFVICDETIKNEQSIEREMTVFILRVWLYRKCTGLSQINFSEHRELGDKEAFFCLHCQLKTYKAELTALKSTVELLSTMISQLEEKLSAQQHAPVENQYQCNRITSNYITRPLYYKCNLKTCIR